MYLKRVTFRVPISLWKKIHLLAKQNRLSLNSEMIELCEYGILYFLEKTKNELQKEEEEKNV